MSSEPRGAGTFVATDIEIRLTLPQSLTTEQRASIKAAMDGRWTACLAELQMEVRR